MPQYDKRFHRSPEYIAWQNMIQRCTNKKFRQYKDYGGRGIVIEESWRGERGFERFLSHVGLRPSPKHTLDRKENNLGYVVGNVRWSTRKVQNRNTSKNVFVDGKTLAEWSEITGIAHSTIRGRIKLGWIPEVAVSKSARIKRNSFQC